MIATKMNKKGRINIRRRKGTKSENVQMVPSLTRPGTMILIPTSNTKRRTRDINTGMVTYNYV